MRFRRHALSVCFLLMLLAGAMQPAHAVRLISLTVPDGEPADGHVPFTVFGDNLQNVRLRVWRVPGDTPVRSAKHLAYDGRASRRAAPDVTFSAPLTKAGLYLAEASSEKATHSVFFRLVAVQRAVLSISLSSPGNTVPSESIPFTVSSNNFTLEAARVSIWRLESGPPHTETLAFSGRGKRPKDEGSVTVRAPLLRAGLYFVEAKVGGFRSIDYLRVSDLGIVTKRAPHELLVYAVRLTTGKPQPKTVVRVDDRGEKRYDHNRGEEVWVRRPGPSRSQSVGVDGLAHFYTTPAGGTLQVVATSSDESRAQTEAPLEQTQENDLCLYFYTERPVYRPGHKVYFKGVVRRDLSVAGKRGVGAAAGSQYAPVRQYPVHLEVTNAQDQKIETLELRTNNNGSFSGELELADDAPVGFYSVETTLKPIRAGGETASFHNRFAVQEYRKPEYEITLTPLLSAARPWARQSEPFDVRVSARYYFGGAVKGGKLTYRGAAHGQTRLNAQGEALIRITNPDVNGSIEHTLNVQVTDDSNRVVEQSVTVAAPWSEVAASIGFSRNTYKLGDNAQVTVITKDPAGRAVSAPTAVTLYFFREVKTKDPETLSVTTTTEKVPFWTQKLQTDAAGHAVASVKMDHASYIEAEVDATDTHGRTVHAKAEAWVTAPRQHNYYGYEFPAVQLLLDEPTSAPGKTVRALIITDEPGPSALMTLQGDRIFMQRVIPLTGNATPFEFTFPAAAAPGAHLCVGVPRANQWANDTKYVKALDPAQRLNIAVRPSKPIYRPGETARYMVETRDGTGQPRGAEVSLSFVDKAIYAIAQDETPDPTDIFYGQRADRVATAWFLPEELQGGSYQRIQKAVPVRQRFMDTAYWNPFVTTGADGMGAVQFTWPENLTTWRATARGVTADTRVGVTLQDTIVTKPLLVRLLPPRFLVQEDAVEVQVIVQNTTRQAIPVRVSLRSDHGQLAAVSTETGSSQNGTVAAEGSQSFFWRAGVGELPLDGTVAFTATARGEAVAGTTFDDSTDAMKLTLPVKPRGVRVRTWQAGYVGAGSNSSTMKLPLPAGPIAHSGELEVNVSPSLAGPMLAALPELQGFPYGCTEQTLSRFVPAVVAARTLKQLGKPLPVSMKELPKQVKQGINTLAGLQHDDGGWGWWREDADDPFLTGYAVYSLSLAMSAGYAVDRGMVVRGLQSIEQQFQKDDRANTRLRMTPDTRAFMMLGYASGIVAAKVVPRELRTGENDDANDDYLGAVFNVRDQLHTHGVAALALAFAEAQRSGQRTVMLGDEAALAYLMKLHATATTEGVNGRYYRSKNGPALYYKDAKTGEVTYVEIPEAGLAVAEGVAAAYSKLKGYRISAVPGQIEGISADPKSLPVLIAMLEKQVATGDSPTGPTAYWQNGVGDQGWSDSDVETTALALRALMLHKPTSPLIQPAIRWMMAQRQGSMWSSTKDTAQAVITLAAYLQGTNELAPDETVRVLVNGKEHATLHFTAAAIGAPDERVKLKNLSEGANITIERAGRGVVYSTAQLIAYTTQGIDEKVNNGFSIERRYAIRNEKGYWREITGPLPNGELVRVELRIIPTQTQQYVLVEDALPAGFELRSSDNGLAWAKEEIVDKDCDCRNIVLDPPPGWDSFPVTHSEEYDDHVAFFASIVPDDKKYLLRYVIRPETRGTRAALPARIESMYHPEINGRTAIDKLEVTDARPE